MGLIKATFKDFFDDNAPRLAAALSYYTIFALPPLLVLILMIAGAVVDPADLQGRIQTQMQSMLGPDAAAQVTTIIENASRPGTGGVLATVLSIAALLFGATGAFAQLQAALNTAWEVKPDPEQGGLKGFIMKRVTSFGMILGVVFLLLVSLVVSAAITAFGDMIGGMLGGLSGVLLQVIQVALSLGIITLLFATIFKVLPDAKIAWKDVWVGAAVTALLFVVGKFLIGFYISRSEPGSAYGAAASLAVILVWVYYAALILLLGAEFTQQWARRKGGGIEPEDGAVRAERHVTTGERT